MLQPARHVSVLEPPLEEQALLEITSVQSEQVPLIKMINGVEEVFVLLFLCWITNTCFESIVLRVSKVRLFKYSIGLLAHDKKKDGKPRKARQKMFQQIHLGVFPL